MREGLVVATGLGIKIGVFSVTASITFFVVVAFPPFALLLLRLGGVEVEAVAREDDFLDGDSAGGFMSTIWSGLAFPLMYFSRSKSSSSSSDERYSPGT